MSYAATAPGVCATACSAQSVTCSTVYGSACAAPDSTGNSRGPLMCTVPCSMAVRGYGGGRALTVLRKGIACVGLVVCAVSRYWPHTGFRSMSPLALRLMAPYAPDALCRYILSPSNTRSMSTPLKLLGASSMVNSAPRALTVPWYDGKSAPSCRLTASSPSSVPS